jgi:hypothetical protein
MASRVEAARSRQRRVGVPRRARERAELVFLWFPIIPLAVVIALLNIGGALVASQIQQRD